MPNRASKYLGDLKGRIFESMRGRLGRAIQTRETFLLFDASYTPYRRNAAILKPIFFAAFVVINSISYAEIEFQSLNGVNRIRGPLSPLPKVEVSASSQRGGGCGPVPTRDLKLQFEEKPTAWLEGMESVFSKKNLKNGPRMFPCEISAQPLGEKGYEIILSYPAKKASKDSLQTLVFKTSDRLVIDHWVARFGPKKKVSGGAPSPDQKKSGGTRITPGNSPLKMSGTLLDVFEDNLEWDKVLGTKVVAFDLNSPELDRFRWPQPDPELGISNEPVERRKLALPYLDFPSLDQTLKFQEKELSLKKNFSIEDLDPKNNDLNERDPENFEALMQGMNFLLVLARSNDWLKTQKALEILEKSQVAKFLPEENPRWWALKGLIYIKLSYRTEQKEFRTQGLEIWRQGIRKLAGRGGPQTEFVEFMMVESVRYLLLDQVTYAAAAILAWSQSFSWSQEVEERFGFLNGEIYFQLGLYSEAYTSFDKFYQMRSDKPLNASLDRRLVPASAFRLGDIMFRQNKFVEARSEYTRALTQLSTMSKFAFEGGWFPEEVAKFPHVFFNRSEASLRLGYEQQALKDLRAFVFVAPNHPKIGLVLFRIGEVLQNLNAPEEMVMNAWRECVFRVPETLGAKLCNARRSAGELKGTGKDGWPRLIGLVEEALPQGNKKFWESLWPDDLEVYVNLILADAFLALDEPRQALLRLENIQNREPSPYLKVWFHEYLVSCLAGDLDKNIMRGEFKEVIARYEPRKRDLFLNQVRPEILWRVAKAFEGLNLYEEADRVLTLAEKVHETLGRTIPRPYDPVPEDWRQFRASVNLGFFSLDTQKKEAALEALKALNPNLVTSQRLWLKYGDISNDPKIRAEAWKKLEGMDPLNWGDIELYIRAVEELGDSKEYAKLLERTLGVWFGDVGKGADAQKQKPPATMLMRLADSRLKENANLKGALAVLDYLGTLGTADLGVGVTKSMIAFKRGQALKNLGRFDDARQSFVLGRTTDPDGVWGRLSSSAEKDLNSSQKNKSQLR